MYGIMNDHDSILAKIHVFSPETCTGVPPDIFLMRTRTVKTIADILHSSILSLLYTGANKNVQKFDILMASYIDSSVPPEEHAIVIHTYNDMFSLSSSGNANSLNVIRQSILFFLRELQNVLEMISNHSSPDLINMVHGSTLYLDGNILGHPDPLIIDTADKIRSVGKHDQTEIHISVIADNGQETQLTLPIPSRRKYTIEYTEKTEEYMPRGFTRSKDGKWYVLFENEQERFQYDIHSKCPDFHQLLSEAYRHQLPLIVTYRGIRVIEAGKEYVIKRKIVSLSETHDTQHHQPPLSDELAF